MGRHRGGHQYLQQSVKKTAQKKTLDISTGQTQILIMSRPVVVCSFLNLDVTNRKMMHNLAFFEYQWP